MGIREWLTKPKYRILFLRREYNAMFIIKKKTFTNIKALTKANSKQYLIDVQTPAHIFQNIFTYMVDYDTGKQLTYNEVDRQMTPEELDLIIGTKIIKELTAGVMNNSKEKILWAILGAVIGILTGVVIMQQVMNAKIEEIQALQNPTIPVLPTLGKAMIQSWRLL